METIVSLVRHGRTLANLEDRFAGRSAEPLHAEGVAQMETLGQRLRQVTPPIALVVTGPLARTRESGDILARHLGVATAVDERFTDIAIPHWDSLTKAEIRARFGDQYPTWKATPHLFRVAGCETIADVQARATAAVEELFLSHPNSHLLIVSHLVVIRALLLHYLDKPIADYRSLTVANGQVCRLLRDTAGRTRVTLDG